MQLELRKYADNVYVISDIHNDYINFKRMSKKIKFHAADTLYILGDVFDKGYHNPQPIELYHEILRYNNGLYTILDG